MDESGQRERYCWASYETRCLNDYGPLMLMKFVKNHLLTSARHGHRLLLEAGNFLKMEEKYRCVCVCLCECVCVCVWVVRPQSKAAPFYPAFVTTCPCMRPSTHPMPGQLHMYTDKPSQVGFPAS